MDIGITGSKKIKENINNLLKFKEDSLNFVNLLSLDPITKAAFNQYLEGSENTEQSNCIRTYVSLHERITNFVKAPKNQNNDGRLIGFLSKQLLTRYSENPSCSDFASTAVAHSLSLLRHYPSIHQNLLDEGEEITSKINTLARQGIDTIPYNYLILSINNEVEAEKIQLLKEGMNAGCKKSLYSILEEYIKHPDYIQNLLGNVQIDFVSTRKFLSKSYEIPYIEIYYNMLKYGIGGEKLSSQEIYNDFISKFENVCIENKPVTILKTINTEGSAVGHYIHEPLPSLTLQTQLLLDILSENSQSDKYNTLLKQYLYLLCLGFNQHALLKKSSSIILTYKALHYLVLGNIHIKNDKIVHDKMNYIEKLVLLNPGIKDREPHRLISLYLSYYNLLKNQKTTSHSTKAVLYLNKAKQLGYEKPEKQEEILPKSSKSEQRRKKTAARVVREIKANQRLEEKKQEAAGLELKKHSSRKSKSRNLTAKQRPLWVDYAINSEQRVSAKKEAMELAQQKDEATAKKARLKAAKKRPEVEVKKEKAEDIIVEEKNIAYQISINKKNRRVLLNILSFAHDRTKEIELVSKGTTTLTRKDILDLINQLSGTSGQGKGSHEGGRIPRIDLNLKAIKTKEIATSLTGPESFTEIFPKDKEVKQAYIRKLANELLALGYNQETVTEKRNRHEEI